MSKTEPEAVTVRRSPWNPQDVADHITGRQAPQPQRGFMVVEAEYPTIHRLAGDFTREHRHREFHGVWIAGAEGPDQALIWPMDLGHGGQDA